MAKGKRVNVEYKTLVVIWLALLTSQVAFLVLIAIIKPQLFNTIGDMNQPFLGEMPLVTVTFALIGIVFVVLSIVLSRQHMRRAVEDQDAGCVQTGLVLGCALSEVASLLGVVLAFMFEHPYFYLWIALGTLGILIHFPRRGSLDAASGPALNSGT